MKRCKLRVPSKLHSARVLEGISFCNAVLKKGNRNTKRLAYTSLVRPILEHGTACWNACTERADKCAGPSTNESCSIY